MIIVRLHKVNFNLDLLKHTVYFAEQAKRAAGEALMGWANPGNSRAVVADTEEAAVERIREALAIDIANWDSKADLKDFSFNVAIEEVKDGLFWSSFRKVTGNSFKVHEFNEWGR
jgi:hypothetical protein